MNNHKYIITLLTLIALLVLSESAFAQKKGGASLGVGAGIATAGQDDINNYITSLNLTGTKQLSSAYEGYAQFGYRFKGSSFGVLLRPTYMMQSATGGNVSVSLGGFTFIPMLRIFPLENKFMRFIMQVGAGFGYLSGTISNSAASVKFNGSTFGAQAGLGAEFCFTPSHCLSVEGNLRYMPIYRNIVTSTSGAMGGTMGSPLQNGELETINGGVNSNVVTSLGGLTAYAGYVMYF